MMNILPKKFLPAILIAIIATQFLTLPVMAQNSLGSKEQETTSQQNLTAAKNNYNIVKAYAEYEKNPSDAKAQQTLTKALTSAGYTSPTVTSSTTDTKTAINSWMTTQKQPVIGDSTAETLKTAEQNLKTRQSEYEVVLGTKNSNELVNNAGDKKTVAESVYRYQSIERMQKLNCVRTGEKDQPPASALCGQLITEYNNLCGSLEKCQITKTATDDKQNTTVLQADFDVARKAVIADVQNVESTLQQKFKETMLGQKLEVSKILTYTGQTSYVGKEKGIVYFISRVVDSLVIAVSSLAVVALIIGGYMLITSGGDEQKRENGKSAIKYTIIGLFFVFGSYAIVSLIIGLLYL